jgi:hypothetical protein
MRPNDLQRRRWRSRLITFRQLTQYFRVFNVVNTHQPKQAPCCIETFLIRVPNHSLESTVVLYCIHQVQIEMLYCFKSHKDLFSKQSVAKRAMRAMHLLAARQICWSLRSEYYGGNDGLKLLSQFFKRVMLQYISGNSDGMPGPQISKQMLQCGTCSEPKTIGLTYEKLGIWPYLYSRVRKSASVLNTLCFILAPHFSYTSTITARQIYPCIR